MVPVVNAFWKEIPKGHFQTKAIIEWNYFSTTFTENCVKIAKSTREGNREKKIISLKTDAS